MRSSTVSDPARRRYELIAPIYDLMSGEGPWYSAARQRAVDLLNLRPGAHVLDVACGTGRNFNLIEQRIGPSGALIAVDRSPRMLEQARRRVARRAWQNVRLLQCDVQELTPALLKESGGEMPQAGFDAVLCTLGLSVIADWRSAWDAMRDLARPGGRVAVMDGGYAARPGAAGEAVAFRPLAWLVCRIAAADARRQPWELVERDTEDVTVERFTYGYVATAAGTARSLGGRERDHLVQQQAQPVHRVPDIDKAGVERRQPEAHHVRGPVVGHHVVFGQRPADVQGVGDADRDL